MGRIEVGLDADPVSLDPHVQLSGGMLQRVAIAVPPQSSFFRPVGANDQDAFAADSAAQVKEQADGGSVCPLQIVQEQHQRVLGRGEHVEELLEDQFQASLGLGGIVVGVVAPDVRTGVVGVFQRGPALLVDAVIVGSPWSRCPPVG